MTADLPSPADIAPAEGRLGVLIPGLGAVGTTVIAGVAAIRRGLARPIGSLTQMGRIRCGKRTAPRFPLIRELVPLADLDDIVFGGWDIFEEDACASARNARVLEPALIDQVAEDLAAVRPMKAVFFPEYVKKLHGTWVKAGESKMALAEQLRADIRAFRERHGCDRLVMIWCGSTEVYLERQPVHERLDAFEAALRESHPAIAPSMIYAYAALKEGVPFANGAPNLTLDIPAMRELALAQRLPIAGKDFKTGQTLMKTIIAPGLAARLLGVDGWFSTNILGNRDGEVLDDPEAFHTKEVSKLGVLERLLPADRYPDLYGGLYHKVRINYYPPRGDQKEGWDNIDIRGWLGYPMQIKVDFLCRDSILAAPIVLDLALFLDLARRAGMTDIQEWLSFYFKTPMTAPEVYPQHSLFIQQTKLENVLRYLVGEEQITHLGLDYYE